VIKAQLQEFKRHRKPVNFNFITILKIRDQLLKTDDNFSPRLILTVKLKNFYVGTSM
jgi:hypothetical protein